MMTETSLLSQARAAMRAVADPARAEVNRRFFKTGPGQYGEGDLFLGVTVPDTRKLVREFAAMPIAEAEELLRSPVHEERLLALLILVRKYQRGDAAERKEIFQLYLRNTARVNNWDLVDLSAEHIVGGQLFGRSTALLDRLAKSRSLWERRIAMLATFHFIRRGEFEPTLRIAKRLLGDEHDLIHKAVGWMLREVGNRDLETEERFLRQHAATMPRTMLRYAIEKFPEAKRGELMRMKN
jgi:3-methyladenine DNA glycosylase AlkD